VHKGEAGKTLGTVHNDLQSNIRKVTDLNAIFDYVNKRSYVNEDRCTWLQVYIYMMHII
jgi:hypothetical protein